MTPPVAGAALRARHAEAAPLRLPPAPRRVSGPSRHPRATPATPATRTSLLLRLIDHPWLERLVRGRAWIAIVATALLGIVAMQVALLRLGAQIGSETSAVNALTAQNETTQTELAVMEASHRLSRAAASLRMVYPAPGAVTYLQAYDGDAARAARTMTVPSGAAIAAAAADAIRPATLTPVTPPPATTPVSTPATTTPAAGAGTTAGTTPAGTTPASTTPAGASMVSLGGGAFTLGDSRETVRVAPFSLDTTEVTVNDYNACVASGACSDAHVREWRLDGKSKLDDACNYGVPDRGRHPMNCVDWAQASAHCRFRKKRLPTEAEWEWAARGQAEGRVYPWGNDPPGSKICWSGSEARHGTCAVGTHPAGAAPGGIHDLAGNVAEWTTTPFEGSRSARITRGGGWNYTDTVGVRAADRHSHEMTDRVDRLGFRCAR